VIISEEGREGIDCLFNQLELEKENEVSGVHLHLSRAELMKGQRGRSDWDSTYC
jgi:hypothetical protein